MCRGCVLVAFWLRLSCVLVVSRLYVGCALAVSWMCLVVFSKSVLVKEITLIGVALG